MARALKAPQHQQTDEVTNMQAVGGGVDAVIEGNRTRNESRREGVPVGRIVYQTTSVKVGQQIFGHMSKASWAASWVRVA